jgi:cytosine/creatinine deaminase
MQGVSRYEEMMELALEEAQTGMAEGCIPIGAALFGPAGDVLGRGHNRILQDNDPSAHAEVCAFRNAGRLSSYRDTTLVTTGSPCWYCSGLVREFHIGTVVIGDATSVQKSVAPPIWLAQFGVKVVDLQSEACRRILRSYIAANPDIWQGVLYDD